MFVRTQTNGSRTYLLPVDNIWADGKVKQRVLARLDEVLASLAMRHTKTGPALIFQRLWQSCSIDKVLAALLLGSGSVSPRVQRRHQRWGRRSICRFVLGNLSSSTFVNGQ